jgi:hypothetical protein
MLPTKNHSRKGKTNKGRKHGLSVGSVNYWLQVQSSLVLSTAEILKASSAGPASHKPSCVKCKVYPLENSLGISSHEIKRQIPLELNHLVIVTSTTLPRTEEELA